MKDIGEVVDSPKATNGPSKPRKYYPSITVDGADFPGLAGHAIGEECVIPVKVMKKREAIEAGETGRHKKEHRITLEIRGMHVPKAPAPKSIREAEHMLTHGDTGY